MILEAKYLGPFAKVQVPGFEHKTCKRGETTKMRIPAGRPIGACWEITKGKKEYEAGLKKAEDDRIKVAEARAKRRQDAIAAAQAKRDKQIELADAQAEAGDDVGKKPVAKKATTKKCGG